MEWFPVVCTLKSRFFLCLWSSNGVFNNFFCNLRVMQVISVNVMKSKEFEYMERNRVDTSGGLMGIHVF